MAFTGGVWVDNALPDNVTDIVDIVQYNNTITNNAFGISILFAFFVVMFIATGREPKTSLPTSLFTTTLVSIFMAVPSPPMVGVEIVASLVIATVISTIIMYSGGES